MPSERIGIYPGTFDPITKGHMDVIKRALGIVDRLIIAIAEDISKTPLFSLEERVQMVREDVIRDQASGISDPSKKDNLSIEVEPFKGLLVNFADRKKAAIIIRGLRAVSDFEYEFQLAAMNYKLCPDIQTVFLPASENTQFIASRLVKEIARLGGDISPFVSANVSEKLLKRCNSLK